MQNESEQKVEKVIKLQNYVIEQTLKSDKSVLADTPDKESDPFL